MKSLRLWSRIFSASTSRMSKLSVTNIAEALTSINASGVLDETCRNKRNEVRFERVRSLPPPIGHFRRQQMRVTSGSKGRQTAAAVVSGTLSTLRH